MPKRILFTNITRLPPEVTREVAVAMVHNHDEMIELNPLVIEHHPIKTPRDAPADEFLDCVWQELTDKINYLPGGIIKGKVTYKACFHDLPMGLQTHIYAPTGLDIREKWSVAGSLPGEPPEVRELGIDIPTSGLYLKEECDMRCNRFLASFVRKNLDAAHKTLVERILKKAQLIEQYRDPVNPTPTTQHGGQAFQPGSHMARSRIPLSPTLNQQHYMLSPQGEGPNMADHPAFRNHNRSWSSSQAQSTNSMMMQNGQQSYSGSSQTIVGSEVLPTKHFVAELPGDYEHLSVPSVDNRQSMVSELTGSDPGGHSYSNPSDRGSLVSADNPSNNHPRYNPQDYTNFAQAQVDNRVERDRRVSEWPSGAQQQQYR